MIRSTTAATSRAAAKLIGATEPREKPILFSAPMIRAILSGQKTMTRRVVKPFPPSAEAVLAKSGSGFSIFTDHSTPGAYRVAGPVWAVRELMGSEPGWRCPYGVTGTKLWVRETWSKCAPSVYPCPPCWFRADFGKYDDPASETTHRHTKSGSVAECFACAAEREGKFLWRPSIYIPRALSRITLEITSARVERLQAITEEDAHAEGVEALDGSLDEVALCARAKQMGIPPTEARVWFAELWQAINGKRPGCAWEENPFCWAISFRRVQP